MSAATDGLAAVFGALADPTRLRILELLAGGERRVTEVHAHIGGDRPTVRYHLDRLRAAQVVEVRRAGKFHFYRLSPGGAAGRLADLLPDGSEPVLRLGAIELAVPRPPGDG